jgi:NADH dehydrogenase (ubiquinone) 1 alpha subcomplex subunit 9
MASMVNVHGPGGRSSVNGIQAAVFGASGFLGGHVVNSLGRRGSQVICPHRSEPDEARHLKVMGDLGMIHILPYELKNEESVRQAVEGCNVVINLIGAPWETRNFSFQDIHVDGAELIAQAAADAGADRMIHVSHLAQGSCPSSKFATTKAEGEARVRAAFPEATIVRPATMFGSGDRFTQSTSAIGKLLPVFPIIEGGAAKRSPVFVTDVAEGIVACLRNANTAGKVVEFVGPTEYTLEKLYAEVFDQINLSTRTIWTPKQAMDLVVKVVQSAPILGRAGYLVEDDVELSVVDEVTSEGTLRFSDVDITPEYFERQIGEAVRRFRKDALRESDAGMQI